MRRRRGPVSRREPLAHRSTLVDRLESLECKSRYLVGISRRLGRTEPDETGSYRNSCGVGDHSGTAHGGGLSRRAFAHCVLPANNCGLTFSDTLWPSTAEERNSDPCSRV